MNSDPYPRSIDCEQPAFLMLNNCTERTVDVIWIDYNSKLVQYTALAPADKTPLNTFSTHPWIFKDHDTGERMHVNHSEIYWPFPWVNDQKKRIRVLIHLPMRTLRTIAMWEIMATKIKSVADIALLELPVTLKHDLFNVFKHRYT